MSPKTGWVHQVHSLRTQAGPGAHAHGRVMGPTTVAPDRVAGSDGRVAGAVSHAWLAVSRHSAQPHALSLLPPITIHYMYCDTVPCPASFSLSQYTMVYCNTNPAIQAPIVTIQLGVSRHNFFPASIPLCHNTTRVLRHTSLTSLAASVTIQNLYHDTAFSPAKPACCNTTPSLLHT